MTKTSGMKTKVVVSLVFLVVAFGVQAATECDLQAKPALGCPTGYSVMCIPIGTPHWGCGKEANGVITEAPPTATASQDTNSTIYQYNQSDLDFINKPAGTTDNTLKTTPPPLPPPPPPPGDPDFDLLRIQGDPDFDTRKTVPTVTNEGRDRLRTTPSASSGLAPHEDGDPDRPIIEKIVPTITAETNEDLEPLKARLSSGVVVKKVEVRGWDPKKKEEFLANVKTHAELKSGQDLENFARGVLIKDENVEDIAVGEENVRISYKQPAKFLGIFNASLTMQAEASSDGRVKVKFPWYRVFFKRLVNDIEVRTEAEKEIKSIKQVMQTQVRESAMDSTHSTSSPQTDEELEMLRLQDLMNRQSRMLQMLSNILKTHHDTAMSVIRNMK